MEDNLLSEAEKAWLACAIDSEGSISFRRMKNARSGKTYTRPAISVYNTSKAFIDHFANLTAQRSYYWRSNGYGNKRLYACSTQNRTLLRLLLEATLPYLIVKKRKAQTTLLWVRDHPLKQPKKLHRVYL